MSVATPLRLMWFPGILEAKGPRKLRTDSFFVERNITVASEATNATVSLYCGNPRTTIHYFAQEADRFGSAAFESLQKLSSTPTNDRAIAWLCIRAYYAAFFAVHSLLRISGTSCTQFTKAVTGMINRQLSSLYPGSEPIEKGIYMIKMSGGGRDLTCTKISAGGGSHEALWCLLSGYLDEIVITVAGEIESPDSASLIGAINDLQTLMAKAGGSAWFTQVRNRINYSHEYGVWYPYDRSTQDLGRAKAILDLWDAPPESVLSATWNDDLAKFLGACTLILSIARTTIEDIVYRSSPRSPFALSSGLLIAGLRSH